MKVILVGSLIVSLLVLIGCSEVNNTGEEYVTYVNNNLGIQFEHPNNWIETDMSMGNSDMLWLVIGAKEFRIIDDHTTWPTVQMIYTKNGDKSIINKRIESFKEEHGEDKISNVEIGRQNFVKYETSVQNMEILDENDDSGRDLFI